MTWYNSPPDTSHRKPTLPPLQSLQEPLPVIGADEPTLKPKARQGSSEPRPGPTKPKRRSRSRPAPVA